MKRLQIYIDEDLDQALAAESRPSGRSKAALIRESVAARFRRGSDDDPLDSMVGVVSGSSCDSENVDEVVYGAR